VARSTIPAKLVAVPEERFGAALEATAYFAVAEALTNAARHAAATQVEVEVVRLADRLRVDVRDNGRGGADPAAGSGLRGLADRVAALDGRVDLISAPSGGTTLQAELPCAS
jgi:signal transduction histidine kinase